MQERKTDPSRPGVTPDGDVYEQRISVPFDYPVHFTRGIFDPGRPLLADVIQRKGGRSPHRLLACLDAGLVAAHPALPAQIQDYCRAHAGVLELVCAPLLVPGGEKAKDGWGEVHRLLEQIGSHRLCRQSFVLAAGGGSALDLTGMAAALAHRGIRLIRLPTTVLAQNDAGIGVKNGINGQGAKNFIGTFAPPFAVINDASFLPTLQHRDWVGGIAEAFKVAILKDRDFFLFLCKNAAALRNRDLPLMETLIRRCARLHLDHIRTGGDPFEFGSSRPLDFGHWSAHRLESLSGFTLGHGQAVAIGIALDSCHALRLGHLTTAELEMILTGLQDSGLPLWDALLEKRDGRGQWLLLEGLRLFQEHLGGELSLALPRSIGSQCEIHEANPALIRECVEFLRARYSTP